MSLVTDELLANIQSQLGTKVTGQTVIGHGAHNQNCLLETSQGKLLLRVYANTQFKNAEKEYDVLRTIDGFLGPRHSIWTHRGASWSTTIWSSNTSKGRCSRARLNGYSNTFISYKRLIQHNPRNR